MWPLHSEKSWNTAHQQHCCFSASSRTLSYLSLTITPGWKLLYEDSAGSTFLRTLWPGLWVVVVHHTQKFFCTFVLHADCKRLCRSRQGLPCISSAGPTPSLLPSLPDLSSFPPQESFLATTTEWAAWGWRRMAWLLPLAPGTVSSRFGTEDNSREGKSSRSTAHAKQRHQMSTTKMPTYHSHLFLDTGHL